VTDAGLPARPAAPDTAQSDARAAATPAAQLRFPSAVATGRGDDGTTGLLFGGARIRKDDPRTEAYGTIDEAIAALGLARAYLANASFSVAGGTPSSTELAGVLLRFQRELFVAGAELATGREAWNRLVDGRTRVSQEMVEGVEDVLADVERRIDMPREFVVPGETAASAAIELGRAVLRRAERRAVALDAAGEVAGAHLLRYLNRLADLLWVLARAAEQSEARTATPSRAARPSRRDDAPRVK
jgi:cob(I)alamin adenosyltransferase